MLREDVGRYIALSRSFGRKHVQEERLLLDFAARAEARGEDVVRSATAIGWARRPSAQYSKVRLRTVRNFAIAMQAEDRRHEIPPMGPFGDARYRRPCPFPLTREQVALLMNAALELPQTRPFTRRTWYVLIGLMAVTGMRASEAVSLRLGDLAADGLIIRNSKFGKTRLLPLHPSTWKALDAYLIGRMAVTTSDDHLFVTAAGTPPTTGNLRKAFIAAGRRCGLRGGKGMAGPRLHDLRHGFATRSLERMPAGADVGRHVLALSTYLGHANLSGTYWYLEATPTIMQGIADATERLHLGQVAS